MSAVDPIVAPAPGALFGAVRRYFVTLGAGELAGRLIGFGATIYVARQLGAEAYGILGFAAAVALYFSIVADAGIEQLGPRVVADAGESARELIPSIVLTRTLASAVLAALLAAVGLFAVDAPDGPLLALYAIGIVAVGANPRWALIGLERPRRVSAARIIGAIVNALIVFAFVRSPESLLIVPLAQLAGDFLAVGIMLAGLDPGRPRARVRLRLALPVFRQSSPLLATSVLAVVIYNSDVLFIRLFHDAAQLGFYLAAYTLINFLGVLGNLATMTLLPVLTRLRSAEDGGEEVYRSAVIALVAAALPAAAGAALIAGPLIALVFGPEYGAASLPLAILIWSIPLLLVRSVYHAMLIAAHRQDRVLRATVVAAALNVSANLVLIPILGIVGAAIATVAAELVRATVAGRYATAEGFRIPGPRVHVRAVAAVLLMAGMVLLLGAQPLWLRIPAGALVYLMAIALFYGRSLRGRGRGSAPPAGDLQSSQSTTPASAKIASGEVPSSSNGT